MFVYLRYTVFLRDLIDSRLGAARMSGSMFCKAYGNFKMKSYCASVQFVQWRRFALSCKRRTASSAFADFLKLADYQSDDDLSHVYHVQLVTAAIFKEKRASCRCCGRHSSRSPWCSS